MCTWFDKLTEVGGYTVAGLHQDVKQGRAALFKVYQDGLPGAALILSPVGDALEVWGLAGGVGGKHGLNAMLAAVERIAKHLGLSCVWWQTARPGLVKWGRFCGYLIESQQGDMVRMQKCF